MTNGAGLPALVVELVVTLAPVVRRAIADFQAQHDGALPTDDELKAKLRADADRILAEGTEWLATHPPEP